MRSQCIDPRRQGELIVIEMELRPYLSAEIELESSYQADGLKSVIVMSRPQIKWVPLRLDKETVVLQSSPSSLIYDLRFVDIKTCQNLPVAANGRKRAKWIVKGALVYDGTYLTLLQSAGRSLR